MSSARHLETPAHRSGVVGRHDGLAAVIVVALLLLGCGQGSTSAHRVTPSTIPATAATSTPTPEEAAVIAAYRAAEKAFEEAVAIPDPAYPALAATMVDPLLHTVRYNLETDKLNEIVGKGHVELLHPHIVSITGNTAILRDCQYSTLGLFYAKTGAPVPGKSTVPEYTGERVTLVMVAPGVWRASDTDGKVGTCPPGY
jgi:hypothetical protein